jgi:hypothetical protein
VRDALMSGSPPPVAPADAVYSVKVLEAAVCSSLRREVVLL